MSKNQTAINDGVRTFLDKDKKPRKNTVVLNTHNTIEHELVKSMVVYALKKRGTEVYSEAHWCLPWTGMPDVFAPEYPYYVEVLQSETWKKLEAKTKGRYPDDVDQVAFKVEDIMSKEDIDTVRKIFKRVMEELP